VKWYALVIALLVFAMPFDAASAAKRSGKGDVRFRDGASLSDKVVVTLSGATAPPPGYRYQGWLGNADGSKWLDVGTFALDAEGNSLLEWTSPSKENLPATYTQFVVTLVADGEEAFWPASGAVAFQGRIPPELIEPMRLLIVTGPDTPLPDRFGLAARLRSETARLSSEGRAAYTVALEGRSDAMRSLDEQMLNRLVGINDGHFGDWDSDGKVESRSDTYGVIRYAHTVRQTIQPLLDNPTVGKAGAEKALQIAKSVDNILDWSQQIRNLTTVLPPQVNINDAQVVQEDIAWLARISSTGADYDGDGKVNSSRGEGGARAIYSSAQDMGRMQLRVVQP
jgi:hypothetical protein